MSQLYYYLFFYLLNKAENKFNIKDLIYDELNMPEKRWKQLCDGLGQKNVRLTSKANETNRAGGKTNGHCQIIPAVRSDNRDSILTVCRWSA